ncbi:MAG: hypothetical protein IJ809_04945 [Clostridia bacterium]|nr:hypothetical protein [Clostridia bacterium]
MNIEKLNNVELIESQNEHPSANISSLSEDEICILKNIYAGNKSEFTSLAQYTYQHILTSAIAELNNFTRNIEKISIAEMRHFEIIGKILNNSSVDPKFCRYIDNNPNICNYWSSASVSFSSEISDFLNKNIELESAGIKEYLKLKSVTKNDTLEKIVDRILEDEYLHLDFFKKCLES